MKRHLQIHNDEKPSSCNEFNTLFPTKNILGVNMLKEEYIATEEKIIKEEDFVTNKKYVKEEIFDKEADIDI